MCWKNDLRQPWIKKISTIMFYEHIWMELTYLMASSSFVNTLRTLEFVSQCELHPWTPDSYINCLLLNYMRRSTRHCKIKERIYDWSPDILISPNYVHVYLFASQEKDNSILWLSPKSLVWLLNFFQPAYTPTEHYASSTSNASSIWPCLTPLLLSLSSLALISVGATDFMLASLCHFINTKASVIFSWDKFDHVIPLLKTAMAAHFMRNQSWFQ